MLHETLGAPLKAPFRPVFERNLAQARTMMGEAAFLEAWAAGRSSTPVEIVGSAIATDARPAGPADPDLLSARELEVLQLVARHRTNSQIAEVLFISFRTVDRHVDHIRDKLGVGTRHEAVEAARSLGLI